MLVTCEKESFLPFKKLIEFEIMSSKRELTKQEKEEQSRLQEEKNGDFVQYYRKNNAALRALLKLPQGPVAVDIFMFLANYMNQQNAVVCSSKVLQEATGMSRPTVSRAVKLLKQKGFFNVLKSGTTNVYVLNDHVVWTAKRTKKAFCEFEGPILLSVSENKELEDHVKYQTEKHLSSKEES